MLDNLDGQRLGCTLIVWTNGLHIDNLRLLVADLVVAEYKWHILRHTLLANHNTLTALHDEVATDILRALAELTGSLLRRIRQQAEVAADHDGNLADMHMG